MFLFRGMILQSTHASYSGLQICKADKKSKQFAWNASSLQSNKKTNRETIKCKHKIMGNNKGYVVKHAYALGSYGWDADGWDM